MNSFWYVLYNTGWECAWPWIKLWSKLQPTRFFRALSCNLLQFSKDQQHNKRANTPCVWFHALSLGEVISSIPLVREFRNHGFDIIYSTGTMSGLCTAINSTAKSHPPLVLDVFPLPFDAPWLVTDFVKYLRSYYTVLAVFIETDIWPNILRDLKLHGIPSILVNARMRPASHKRYLIARRFGIRPLDMFERIFAASQYEASNLRLLVSDPNRVCYVGNTKWDAAISTRRSETDIRQLRRQIDLDDHRPVWVAGSIHSGEEDIVLDVHRLIIADIPDAFLVIAPRKRDIVQGLLQKCAHYGLKAAVRSEEKSAFGKSVYILDTHGELAEFYGLGRCAFVGGSLVPFGGHNLLEPAVYGIPVCWGPYVFNFAELAEELTESGLGMQVKNSDELFNFVKCYISSKMMTHHGCKLNVPQLKYSTSQIIFDTVFDFLNF